MSGSHQASVADRKNFGTDCLERPIRNFLQKGQIVSKIILKVVKRTDNIKQGRFGRHVCSVIWYDVAFFDCFVHCASKLGWVDDVTMCRWIEWNLKSASGTNSSLQFRTIEARPGVSVTDLAFYVFKIWAKISLTSLTSMETHLKSLIWSNPWT